MHSGNNMYLFKALSEIGVLKEYGKKIKDPPSTKKSGEASSKRERPHQVEANQMNFFSPQAKSSSFNSTSQISNIPECQIIKVLEKCSVLDFTSRKISELQVQFGITEFHLRSLISSVIKYNI